MTGRATVKILRSFSLDLWTLNSQLIASVRGDDSDAGALKII